ncbi:unnamed protein product [Amaranthus hypochondriacus]
MGKNRLDRLGQLPSQLEVDTELIDSTNEYLRRGLINLNVLPQEH